MTKPGVYRVPLGTNVIEVISQAGGPTEFSNLSKVKLTQKGPSGTSRIETVDLARYTDGKGSATVPMLGPGDLVAVPRNTRYAWESSIRLVGDMVTIANLFYLISLTKQ